MSFPFIKSESKPADPTTTHKKNTSALLLGTYIFSFAILLISALTLYGSRYSFLLDLFSHFQLQYGVTLVIFATLLLLHRRILSSCLLFLYVLFVYVFFMHPLVLSPRTPNETDIFFINVYYSNEVTASIVEEIKERDPSIVALVETNMQIIEQLTPLYGESRVDIRGSEFSCTIFSKDTPLSTKAFLREYTFPVCLAQFPRYTLIAIHPNYPLRASFRNAQIKHFEEIRGFINDLVEDGTSYVLVGDFNASRYSATFRRYFGDYEKRTISSWTPLLFYDLQLPFPLSALGELLTPILFSLPIDHALSSLPLDVGKTKWLSSDHVGLLIDVLEESPAQ